VLVLNDNYYIIPAYESDKQDLKHEKNPIFRNGFFRYRKVVKITMMRDRETFHWKQLAIAGWHHIPIIGPFRNHALLMRRSSFSQMIVHAKPLKIKELWESITASIR
jgi:hypothetical protein